MSRRVLLVGAASLLAAACLLYLLFRPGGRFRGATGDANVLLITVDTLRADHLGAYGSREVRTPVIDTLADEGVLFENAITPAVMTLPSHASILTGTYPPTHGIRDNGDYRLAPGALTLAEVLRSRGFRTGAVVGSFVLDSMFGLEQGFEVYDDALPARRPNDTFFAERRAQAVTDAALRFLKKTGQARFFLWTHYYDPHHPYLAPSPFREQYPQLGYGAEISYVDAELGRLLGAMREMGLRDKTLTVFVADHGEGLGNHGEEAHGVFLYEEAVRVPLIIALPPHLPSARRVKGVVRTVDIMPTILDLIRIDPQEAAEPAQGSSLWPLIADEKDQQPGFAAYSEAMVPLLMYGWSPLTAIRDAQYKFIEAPRPELYDLVADPQERNNLAASRTDLVSSYRARLEALRGEVTREGAAAETLSPDPEVEAKLRSLGYAGGGGSRNPGGAPGAAGTGDLADPKDMVPMLSRIDAVYRSFGSGQYEVTEREARSILAENPDNASVRYYLAGALVWLARYPEALREYDVLLKRSPKDTEALCNVGWCLMSMQRFDDATATFKHVLELNPDHIHAQASLANIAFVKGDFREAARIYKDVLKIEPNHLPSIMTLGKMYESAGKLAEAAAFYAHAVDVDPSNVDAWLDLAWLQFQQGKHEESLAVLERARTLAPGAPELQGAVGDVLLAIGKVGEARVAYQKGLQMDQNLPGGYYGLGLIELRHGDPGKAVDLLRRAVDLRPERASWREDLGHALARVGQYEAAAMELQKFLSSGQVPPQRRDGIMREIDKYRRGGG